jgi:lysozyme family protein
MIINRGSALAFIDEDEGPEVNESASEPGGISCRGVSLIALADYNAKHGLPAPTFDDVRAMTAELAGKVYTMNYLDPIRFDDLPSGVDYRLADVSVNLGVTGGITALQLALGMWPLTGIMDAATLGMLNGDAKVTILSLSAAWIAKKHESPNWGPSAVTPRGFGHGWSNRNIRATARAIAMVTK